MKWCCSVFENRYELAGERSIAVLIDEDPSGDPDFLVQARAFDHGSEPPLNVPVPMSLVLETGIQFCPWCGADLKKWYGKYAHQLSRPNLRVEQRL